MAWAEDMTDGTHRKDVLRASPPAIGALLVWGLDAVSVGIALALALAGYALWTLFEYWLHRLVFHFEPDAGIGARLHWIIHGVHHDHPNDPLRLVMPPALSVPLAAALVYGFYLVIGSPGFLPFGAAFLAGYLGYDMLHYHVHHHRPKSALGKRLREVHMRHHFQNHERGYGVSAPFWDHVFGTAPSKTTR